MTDIMPHGKLIGKGAQADVYLVDGQAVKLFHQNAMEDAAFYEADLQQKIYNAGLCAPRVYGIHTVNGRAAIVMEYIHGPSLGSLMKADGSRAAEYLLQAARLQAQMHQAHVKGLPSQWDRLNQRILAASLLLKELKDRLVDRLQMLVIGSVVCHGDFHPYNILQTDQGLVVIDWVDATLGSPMADVCRTYLLYLIHSSEAAELYLQYYCQAAGIEREAVLQWLPIVAGARLSEQGRGDDTAMLLRLAEG